MTQDEAGTGRFGRWLRVAVVKVLMPVAIVVGAGAAASFMIATRPVARQLPVEPPVLLVESIVADAGDQAIHITVPGTVTPHTETTLISEVSGQVLEVSKHFVNGGFLRAGEVVIRIDPRNYIAEVRRAEAGLARSHTQLLQEKSLADYERGDFERLKSQDALSTSDLAHRRLQIAQAEAESAAADAQLVRARGDLDRTVVRMPFDGIFTAREVGLGQFVNPGVPIGVIFAIDYAEVRLPLSPRQAREVTLPGYLESADAPKTPVSITTEAGDAWSGSLVRTEGTLDSTSRTLYAIARVDDPYGLLGTRPATATPLRIGTYVDVTLRGRTLANVVALPRHLLKPGNQVWIIDDELRIQARSVDFDYADSRFVYVSAGIEHGDQICMTPIDNPLPGTRVRIIDTSS
jgi:RND family efflux transporter MFP subunit